VSYTVDLVAPDKLGGTNLVRGAKGAVAAPPKVAPKPAAPLPPPLEPEVKIEPKPPPKAEAPPEAKAPPKPPPKADEEGIALAKPSPSPKPAATTTAQQKAVAKKPVTATAKPQQVVRAVATPKAEKPQAKATPPAATRPAKAQATPAPTARVAGAGQVPATPPGAERAARDEMGSARDERIAAAIKRVEQQAGQSGGGEGGTAGTAAGGPLSIGPGEGAGGEVRGIEFLMYQDQMTRRIKERWTWAGANKTAAIVGFSVLETGEIVNVRTVKSSGDRTYDLSVERAVRAASPLPPPPAEYVADFARVEYTFEPEDASQ
jgi:TonB family protein